eukprot:GHRQ01011694.1.p1 GENE.GHRQ01011694.1~~GHRQ01011694.1.p1  ORF type:complete len:188 (+),score=50.48 GHRQ01011694.1:35-565(+)
MAGWRWFAVSLTLVLLGLPQHLVASKFVPNPSSRLTQQHRTFVDKMWESHMGMPESLIRAGYKHELEGRNWARLAQKLSTEGSTVNIVAFGGSVTVGYRRSNTSYPEELVDWLSDTFPGVKFNLINLARRATAATFAALCLVQDMPGDAGELTTAAAAAAAARAAVAAVVAAATGT